MQSESTYATQKKYSDSKYGRSKSLSDNAMQLHMLQKSGWVEENEITRMAAVKTKFLRNLDLNGTPSHLHIYNLSTSAAWNGYVTIWTLCTFLRDVDVRFKQASSTQTNTSTDRTRTTPT